MNYLLSKWSDNAVMICFMVIAAWYALKIYSMFYTQWENYKFERSRKNKVQSDEVSTINISEYGGTSYKLPDKFTQLSHYRYQMLELLSQMEQVPEIIVIQSHLDRIEELRLRAFLKSVEQAEKQLHENK